MVKFTCEEGCVVTVLTSEENVGRTIACPYCHSQVHVHNATPFTEEDWLTSDDTFLLLQYARLRCSDRKLWLFCFAYARHLLARTLRALEESERQVDQLSHGEVYRAVHGFETTPVHQFAAELFRMLRNNQRLAPDIIASALYGLSNESLVEDAEIEKQNAILRDIVGNPFRSLSIAPALLAWNVGTIPKIATAIYDGRAFGDMPILADALEEAGCADETILSHCRQPRMHVRGCWLLDLVLAHE